nr:GHMP kinase [Allomuricauda sp.]
MITIKVPARICFFGDHQDYLGLPVIAGTINRYIHLSALPIAKNEFFIELKDLQQVRVISLKEETKPIRSKDYFRSGISILQDNGFQFSQGYHIEIWGDTPINAGLSSSSALVVAWIRFLIATQQIKEPISDSQVGRWAYEAEVLFFKQPGGLMDQYTIAKKGLLYLDTKTGESTLLKNSLGKLLVAESGLPKRTLNVLKNARKYAQLAIGSVQSVHPDFNLNAVTREDYYRYLDIVPKKYQNHWFAAVHNYEITLAAKEELLSGNPNLHRLADLMNEHQLILQDQIENTPSKMIQMMDAAKKNGALACKIIGSGGGGCMLALIGDKDIDGIKKAFLETGAELVYEVEISN